MFEQNFKEFIDNTKKDHFNKVYSYILENENETNSNFMVKM